MRLPAPADVVFALNAAYSSLTSVVGGLSELDLLLPSGCRGWSVADLMLHVTLDAQRALVALATPSTAPPDVDFISYWRQSGDGDALDHGQWVRRSAAAYQRPSGIIARWTETSAATARAAAMADPDARISTQGHVLTVPDFLATLVTEAAIHHLDATTSLPTAPDPPSEALAIAQSTVSGLADPDQNAAVRNGPPPTPLPARWSNREALLKATGRQQLTEADRHDLGDRVLLLPLLS